MLQFCHTPVKNIGLAIIGISYIGALTLFIYSLPGIGKGIWFQSETAIAALHGFSALCCLGFTLTIFFRHNFHKIMTHPFVLLPLLIGILSACFTPFYDFPLKNWLGSVRTGEGVIFWLDWATLIAAGITLYKTRFWSKTITITAILSCLTIFVLQEISKHNEGGFTPYYFYDFSAFLPLALIPILCFSFKQNQKKLVLWLALWAAYIFFTYQSDNRIAIAYSVLGVGFFLFLWFVKFIPPNLKEKLSSATVGFIIVAVLVIHAVVAYSPISHSFYKIFNNYSIMTIMSRSFLTQISFESVLSEPHGILTGTGWGMFTEELAKYMPTNWIDFTMDPKEQWDGFRIDHFHSHNMFGEAFYSAGIFALIAFTTFVLSIPLYAKKHLKLAAIIFSGGFAGIGSFWFFMPLNIPFMTLACGALSNNKTFNFKFPKTAALSLLIIVFLSQAIGSYMTLHTALNTNSYLPHDLTIKEAQQNCPVEIKDFGAGGLHLAKLLTNRSRYITESLEEWTKEDPDIIPKQIADTLPKINHLFCQSEIYVHKHKASMRLKMARLIVRSEVLIAFAPWIDQETVDYYYNGWEKDMRAIIEELPQRSDIAVPFLLWHLNHGQEDIMNKMTDLIIERNPNHPVGMWFKGIGLTAKPETAQEGVALMRKALEDGVQRFVPVEPSLKEQLLGPSN